MCGLEPRRPRRLTQILLVTIQRAVRYDEQTLPMIDAETLSRYHFDSADPPHTAQYVTPCVVDWCRRLGAKRIVDLGCGNGALCAALAGTGGEVVGCDPSASGI